MDVEWLGGSKGEGNLAALSDQGRPGNILVEHLVQDDVVLEFVEEEMAHGRWSFSL